jgi:hypothetical protein
VELRLPTVLIAVVAMMLLITGWQAPAAERQRFWNLTTATLTELRLAEPGTDQWGPNQCNNDPDKAVEPDERLTLIGVEPGRYDVKLRDRKGRVCIVRNVWIQSGRPFAFSISDNDLGDCQP